MTIESGSQTLIGMTIESGSQTFIGMTIESGSQTFFTFGTVQKECDDLAHKFEDNPVINHYSNFNIC